MPESDRELLAEILQEHGVVTEPPSQSWTDWLSALVADLLEAWIQDMGGSASWGVAATVVLALLGVGGATMAIGLLARRLRRAPDPAITRPQATSKASIRLSRGDVESLLSGGDTRAAARLSWWWLIEGLAETVRIRPHPDHTQREYVGHLREAHPSWPQLARVQHLARRAEVFAYAPDAPAADAVISWLDEADSLIQDCRSASPERPALSPDRRRA